MSLIVVSECGLLMKPHGEGYLEMSFEDFVEGFDLSDDDRIWWSSSVSSLTNGLGLPVDDEDEFHAMISKLRSQRLPRQVFLMLSHSPIPANTHPSVNPLHISLKSAHGAAVNQLVTTVIT